MANVVLIGATGFVGSAILNELLARGHKVTAVVRNAAKLPKNDNLTAVEEDVANVDAIANIAKGKDADIVIVNGSCFDSTSEIETVLIDGRRI